MIKPVHDNLVVKVDVKEIETKSASGIILTSRKPEAEKQTTGIVVATGEGRLLSSGQLVPSSVKPGDKVIFNAFAGTEILEDDITYLLLKENDILDILS